MQNAKGVERGIRAEYIAGLKKVQASSRVSLLDKTGGEAAALVDQLAALGVRRPTAVEGGMRRWKKDAVPFTTGLGKYESGTLRVLGDQVEDVAADLSRPANLAQAGAVLVGGALLASNWELALQYAGVFGLQLSLLNYLLDVESLQEVVEDLESVTDTVTSTTSKVKAAADKVSQSIEKVDR